ncbi:MAG: Tad domain-containing protein, partial [Chloroflexota bacterium]
MLVGFAFVTLLGIMSLALDGGRLFADRRKAQNTADTASFAGALLIAQADDGDPTDILEHVKSLAIDKAFARTASNGYDNNDPDVDVIVIVGEPLFEEGLYYYTVKVEITSRIDGMLTALVYSGQLTNTVYSIAQVKPVQGIAWGNSLYATA